MSTERQAVYTVGPLFFRKENKTMFQFTIDAGNIIGPNEATSADIEKYPEAYANMAEADEVDEPEELEKTTLHPKTAPRSEPKKPAPWMKKK